MIYQAAVGDSRWSYKPVSHLWPDEDLDGDFSGDESVEEVIKGRENPKNHKRGGH